MSVAALLALGLVLEAPARDEIMLPPPPPHVAEDGAKTGRVHIQLDADATWGIGSQMFLGTQLHLVGVLEHWTTSRAIGTWDIGGNFAYQNEPTFLAPWIDTTQIHGAGHRVQLLASVGHTVHMGRRRRVALGLHAFGGWNVSRAVYSVEYVDEGVSGRGSSTFHRPIVGGELRFAYRFHDRVGLNLMMGAPLPTDSSYLLTLAHVGVGLSIFLR